MIWRIWGPCAFRTALEVSEAKYATARHLEDVARANDFFKSANHSHYAIERADKLSGHYINRRMTHFHFIFSQQISLLVLYAVANAGLLGVGGALVVKGELTLGQLVAAELVLSAVFFGISRLGFYLEQLYDLSAAIEEISRLFRIPLEPIRGKQKLPPKPAGLRFQQVRAYFDRHELAFNLEIQPGAKILAKASTYVQQKLFLDLAKRYRKPDSGTIIFGDQDLNDYDCHFLRGGIVVLDRPTVIECSIIDYLTMDAPDVTLVDIERVLKYVELDERIDQLQQQEHTMMSITGLPLTASETLRLKLAASWLAKPHVLILTEFFDTISFARRQRIFNRLCAEHDMTVFYLSNRLDLDCFDQYLLMGETEQVSLPDAGMLRKYEEQHKGGLS